MEDLLLILIVACTTPCALAMAPGDDFGVPPAPAVVEEDEVPAPSDVGSSTTGMT